MQARSKNEQSDRCTELVQWPFSQILSVHKTAKFNLAFLMQSVSELFSSVDRELWVVTSAADRRSGLVASWVMQASIDPERPRILVGLAPNHFTAELAEQSGAIAVHLVRNDQLALVWRFGLSSGRDEDKFRSLEVSTGRSGAPILEDCLAWADGRVIERFRTPERTFFLAEVIAASAPRSGEALRESAVAKAADPQQRAALAAGMAYDIQVARTRAEAEGGRT